MVPCIYCKKESPMGLCVEHKTLAAAIDALVPLPRDAEVGFGYVCAKDNSPVGSPMVVFLTEWDCLRVCEGDERPLKVRLVASL